MDIGDRVPMATSSSGRAFLAAIIPEEREVFMKFLKERAGDEWPALYTGINQAIANYQEKGYTTSFGEWDRSMNTVAVPIRCQDGKIVCLSCGGPSYLLSPEHMEDVLAPQLVHLGRDIAASRI
jgi:DNA-binding IclR family transcriptional regulator